MSIYLDAEFQTYRNPKGQRINLISTPPYLYTKENESLDVYHFLLNIGFFFFDGVERKYYLASFPSLFDKSGLWRDGQMLEPGYTTTAPDTQEAIVSLRKKSRAAKFAYYSDLEEADKRVFEKIQTTYNSSFTEKEDDNTKTVMNLLFMLLSHGILVHKGTNDLYAMMNTMRLYGYPLFSVAPYDGPITNMRLRVNDAILIAKSKDIERFSHVYKALPGVTSTKLADLKTFFVEAAELKDLENELMTEIRKFIVARYGWAAADTVAAHNPLVDSAYAYLIELGASTLGLP
jgi:hypothetical protein